MAPGHRRPSRLTRRGFLVLASTSACLAASETGKGRTVPTAAQRYADPSTEFPVTRLTDPQYSSYFPYHYGRALARKNNSCLYSSDLSGRMEVYRMDLKTGVSRQLTEAQALDPRSPTMSSDERMLYFFDGGSLHGQTFQGLRSREIYRTPDGFEHTPGFSVAEDSLYAAVVEKKGTTYRLRLVRLADGVTVTLAEAEEEITDPIPRPKRASVLYRKGGAIWLANYDAQQNYRLRMADGGVASAIWSPDGRSVLYLNIPAEPRKLRNLREYFPDSNEDRAIADTTQYGCFERNADASVFVGASLSKASPHVLLMIRSVRRELTLCEHRSSDPAQVAPFFAPNSQHVYFVSDQHGKPALYSVPVEKLVSETADREEQ
jgi:oligogalacturonide lyase